VMTCAADELISSSKIFGLSLCGGPHDRGLLAGCAAEHEDG
jgi:hypothetical protein